MSNSITIEMSKTEAKVISRVIDKCRVKTRLNKESIIDEIGYGVDEDDGCVQLYAMEWLYIQTALEDKLSGTRIQDRDTMEDFLHTIKKLKIKPPGKAE